MNSQDSAQERTRKQPIINPTKAPMVVKTHCRVSLVKVFRILNRIPRLNDLINNVISRRTYESYKRIPKALHFTDFILVRKTNPDWTGNDTEKCPKNKINHTKTVVYQ